MDASGAAPKAVLLALGVTALLGVLKLIVWLQTSSLVLLSQAVDSGLDLVALVLLYLAVRVAERPADESHHYGHAKAENLAAFAQMVVLTMIVAGIAWEAIARLLGSAPQVQVPGYALALLGLSIVVDAVRVVLLRRTARAEGSEALRAGALNFATDIGTAVVALASLLLVSAGLPGADAAGGLLVGAAVLVAAWRLARRSIDVLMDRAPDDPAEAIAAAAQRAPGVAETRRVRVRSGGKQLFADVTVAAGRTSSLERAHDIAEGVEKEIVRVVPGADVVVHVEPTSVSSSFVERVQAAASRTEGVYEVHNVIVHAFRESKRERLHVTLHAKVGALSSLGEAHELSERIEEAVVSELGAEARVDTHVEPLETTAFGTDVTPQRSDIVATVRQVAEAERDVLDCHEVLVTGASGRLSITAHVRGRADLPLARIHSASERIELAIRREVSEAGVVLIHFEPA
ncbi:MAG: cation diffusion facilitator family transporter [Actinomycetota bacterium]